MTEMPRARRSVLGWFIQLPFTIVRAILRDLLRAFRAIWAPISAALVAVSRWTWKQVHRCVVLAPRLVLRMAVDLARHAWRIQKQLKKRATMVLFERLKKSPHSREIERFFSSRLKAGRGSAWELAGLIDFAVSAGKTAQAQDYIHALLEQFPDDIDMHSASAVRCFLVGEYTLAEQIWSCSAELRQRKLAECGLESLNLRFLGPSWFVAIGHIAHLDTYLKSRMIAGGESCHYAPVIPSHFQVPNKYFLDLWKPLLHAVPSPAGLYLQLEEVELLQDEFWSLRLAPGNTLIYHKAGAAVQKAWDDGGWGPLLRIPVEDLQRGWEALETLGVPRGSWFVCLHVREPGFHQKWHKSHPGTRNADVTTYRAAIQAITERGGYVIRVGDSTMVPLPPMPNTIDYAHSDAKSDFMDVFLCATCSFFIGTNSGLGLVPPVFGVPCVLTNWSPIAIPQWYPQDLFVPKLVLSERDNRLLSFEDLYATPAGWKQFEEYFTEHGLRVIDNSPDELRDVVVEMLDRISGTAVYSADDEQRRARFERLTVQYAGYVGSRIGRDFLRKHSGLLGAAPAKEPAAIPPVSAAA